MALEIVGSVSAIVSLVHVTGQLVFLGKSYVSGVVDAPKNIQAFVHELTLLEKVLDSLAKYVTDNPQSSAFQVLDGPDGAILDCTLELKALVTKLETPRKGLKGLKDRLKWPFKTDETSAIISKVGGYRERFTLVIPFDSIVISKEIRENSQDIFAGTREVKADTQEIKTDTREIKTDVRETVADAQEIKADVREIKSDVQETKMEVREIKMDVKGTMADAREVKVDVQEIKLDVQATKMEAREIKVGVREIKTDIGKEATKRSSKDEEKKRKKVLGWLHPERTDIKHGEICRKRQKGTGQWILGTAEFKEWEEERSTSRLLYGFGGPGTGKTYLSSVIIDYFDSKRKTASYGVAYIYLDGAERIQQSPTSVLASILKQLAFQLPHLPVGIEELHRELENEGRRPNLDQLYESIRQLACSKEFNRVFLIIDALDECDQDSQRDDLLPLFIRMGADGINILLTSRPSPHDVQTRLRDAVKIELSAHEEDIRMYIEGKIERDLMTKELVEQAKCKEEIIKQLVDSSKGMFLLARFDLESLCQETTASGILAALDRLKLASGEKRSLDPTYDKAMRAVHKQGANREKLALKIFSWLVNARRTLTVDEIRTAVAVQPGRYELSELDLPLQGTLSHVCAGLVMIDELTKTIRLVHYTVQEYLVEKSIIPAEAELDLAIACATYLSFKAFEEGQVDWMKMLEERRLSYPLLDYATTNFKPHIMACDEDRTTEAVLKFVSSPGCASSYLQNHRSGGRQLIEPIPLNIGAMIGHFAVVRRLLEGGAEITVPGESGRTALHEAASRGYEKIVRLLLQNYRADHSIVDHSGYTALHVAASAGYEKPVRLLLQSGADHSIRCRFGETALQKAADAGREGIVRLLIENGGDMSTRNQNGNTPLHSAARRGQEAVVRLLVTKGANVSDRNNEGDTALQLAAVHGYEKVCQLLLGGNVNISHTNRDRETALHQAVYSGNDRIVQMLLEKGMDVSLRTKDGGTVLHSVASAGCYQGHRRADSPRFKESTRLVIKNSADLSIQDNRGRTALHIAACVPLINGTDALSIAPLLVESGAGLSIRDNQSQTALHKAALKGNEELARLLLKKGADISAIDSSGRTSLHIAAWGRPVFSPSEDQIVEMKGKEAVARLLIENGVDVSAIDKQGQTALHEAAAHGHEGIVRLLLENGTNLSVLNKHGQAAIHKAMYGGHDAIFKLLFMRHGSLVEAKDGKFPLHEAARGRGQEIVHYLLENGADLSLLDGKGQNALHAAASVKDNDKVVRLLLDKIIDLSIQDGKGRTALHLAASTNRNELTVRLLLEKGVDLSIQDSGGRTALHLAASANNTNETIRVLLEKGADLSFRDRKGKTALHLAVETGRNRETVQLLLDKGADLSIRDGSGRAALHLAFEKVFDNDRTAIARLLLERGADMSIQDGTGQTALHLAANIYPNERMFQLLLGDGADLSIRDNKGRTALHLTALNSENAPTVQLLLENGADPSSQDGEGQTPLHVAVRSRGSDKLVRLLLESNTDLSVKDNSGQTALHLAVGTKSNELIVQMLLDKTPDLLIQDMKGRTALHAAVSIWRNDKVVRLLLERNVDLSIKDGTGQTALHWAARVFCNATTIQMLLEMGADPSVRDNLGQIALHKALHQAMHRAALDKTEREKKKYPAIEDYGVGKVIKMFLKKGTDMMVRDCDGYTPFDYALLNGHVAQEAVKLLLEHADMLYARSRSTAEFRSQITPFLWLQNSSVDARRAWILCFLSVVLCLPLFSMLVL